MVQASVDTFETTRARLLSVARDAFLRNGFLDVSLRSIAALAQVTTGAIYGHFSSKEDLFDHVVAPSGDGLFSLYQALIDEFLAFPPEMRSFDAMLDFELEARTRIVDFIYDHPEDFLIIARGSAGTRWEGYLDRFVEAEKSSTVEYEATAGGQLEGIDGMLLEVLARYLVQGLFEPLLRGLCREDAQAFARRFGLFFHHGFQALMEPGQTA